MTPLFQNKNYRNDQAERSFIKWCIAIVVSISMQPLTKERSISIGVKEHSSAFIPSALAKLHREGYLNSLFQKVLGELGDHSIEVEGDPVEAYREAVEASDVIMCVIHRHHFNILGVYEQRNSTAAYLD
ncbi:hypothetical protein WCN91_02230 [Pseudoalteromonas sp. YIC-827]|uniref:Uncharacterized protein n=1 Tax=Pseudoalteromonas qingdaonensis TaxID=3131913 RepID=A0ABU9MSV8_9GAMM